MKIGEILAESTFQQEASYEGNLGFEEVMRFFDLAEKEDPMLADTVERLIARDQFGKAWEYIQKFLGVKLKGPQFSTEEDMELDELESPEQRRQRQLRDLQALGNDPEAAKVLKKAMMARRQKLKGQNSKPKYTGQIDPNKKVKTWNIESTESKKKVDEVATAGATSAGNIASIPIGEIPKDQKAWAGKPGKMGKGPKPVKAKPQKPTDNAINKNANLFTGEPIKR